ncbi:MAG: diguanylate cyclase [Candidatus Riflebacteria bacterium]|nr:diguanylate cyclase [Candidatus Riflebacteria bacterium]
MNTTLSRVGIHMIKKSVSPRQIPFFHRLKVKTWIGVFLLTVVPLALLGWYAVGLFAGISRDQLLRSNLQAFQQVKIEIEHYVNQHVELIQFLRNDARLARGGVETSDALLALHRQYEFIERLVLCASEGSILANAGAENASSPVLSDVERGMLGSNSTIQFISGSFVFRATTEDGTGRSLLGTVSMQKLRKTLEGAAFGTSFRYHLVTREGKDILGQTDFPRALIDGLLQLPFGAYDIAPGTETGITKVALILPILRFGLRVIVVQDAMEVYAGVDRLRRNVIFVVVGVCLVAFLFGTMFSIGIASPINRIAHTANQMALGNLNVSVPANRKDEIGFLASCFNRMTSNIRKKVFEITALYKISEIINQAKSYQQALDQTLAYIVTIFLAKRGSIQLIDESGLELRLKSVREFVQLGDKSDKPDKAPTEHINLKLGEGIAGIVAQSGQPILSMDCANDERFKPYGDDLLEPPKDLLCVPLLIQGKACGVINLVDREPSPFLGDVMELMTSIANQTALSIENAKLHELAITDGLTRLFIHRYFQLKLDDEISRFKRHQEVFSLVMFDIDHFKKFNDTYGHQLGDAVLRETARLVKETVRPTDIPCRYGGEEFAIILSHTLAEPARLFAERLRERIETHPFPGHTEPLRVTISIGVAEFPRMAATKMELVKHTDQALYACKHRGRNCVTVWDETITGDMK